MFTNKKGEVPFHIRVCTDPLEVNGMPAAIA